MFGKYLIPAEGGVLSWWNKMGPYDTQEAAARALETARERTQNWDEADRTFKDEGE